MVPPDGAFHNREHQRQSEETAHQGEDDQPLCDLAIFSRQSHVVFLLSNVEFVPGLSSVNHRRDASREEQDKSHHGENTNELEVLFLEFSLS